MAYSRFNGRRVIINDREEYSKVLEDRNLKSVKLYETPILPKITAKQMSKLRIEAHVWSDGDRYINLSAKYYRNPKLWWVIAQFNLKPTDAHVAIGDTVYIPYPLELVLEYMGV